MTKAQKPFPGTHPISVNHGFKCKKCGKSTPIAKKTCRNHCTVCLFSLHVDDRVPGDRASNCLGLMEPVMIGQSAKKGFQIHHLCSVCGKKSVNKAAPDDDPDAIAAIMSRQNITPVTPCKKKRRRS